MVSGIKFGSFIHFESIFFFNMVPGSSNLISPVSQQHLWNRLSFLHCVFLLLCHRLTIGVWVYFWALSTTALICVSVLIPARCFGYCCFVVLCDI